MPMTAGDRMNGRTRTCAGAWPAVSPGWTPGKGNSRGARSVELLPGPSGDLGAEVGGTAEHSPVSQRGAGTARVCLDEAVLSADAPEPKGPLPSLC